MGKINPNLLAQLGDMLEAPPERVAVVTDETWSPKLNPIQQQVFDSEAPNVLAWGEKLSGKTTIMLHKVVKHCYLEEDALAFVLTSVKSMQEDGGAWHKLLHDVLPQWKEGMGIHFELRHDTQHNEYLWIQNQHGGFSQIKGISCPHPDQLKERFPGREPSCVFVDELTRCSTEEYFKAPSAQLGRRPKIQGVQQFLAACNPESKQHWVYKWWFELPFNEETGEWNPEFLEVYLPLSDNQGNIKEDAIRRVASTYAHDATEKERLVGGKWVDRPSGDAIYGQLFNPVIHVRPILDNGTIDEKHWLKPHLNYPIIVGMDPGAVNNGWVFLQYLPIDGVFKWLIFDEIVTIRKRIDYTAFVPCVMRRILYWRGVSGGTAQTLPQVWISDNSAFNQFRANNGSFDVLEIQKIYGHNRDRMGLEHIRVKQAPKFQESRKARVQLIQRLLEQDKIVVSSRCRRVRNVFLQMETERQKPGQPFDPELMLVPRARQDHNHTHDAMGYPILMASLDPTALVPLTNSGQSFISVRAA